MTRADRIVTLDPQTLAILMILGERPPGGVNRDELATRAFGAGGIDENADKFRHCLGFLRRVFSEDGSVRIVNAPGDCYDLEIGPPVEGRGLRTLEDDALMIMPSAIPTWLGRSRRRGLSLTLAAVVVLLMIVGLALIMGRSRKVVFDLYAHNQPLATEVGENTQPSFSPDGRSIVYRHRDAEGSEHLCIRSVSGGPAQSLTRDAGRDRFPAWSPTGDLIAFQRVTPTGCEVLAIAPGGGATRRLGDCDFGGGGPMTWLPDGKALIYSHRTAWSLPMQIVSVASVDGKMTGVTNPSAGMPGDFGPALAPNGQRLAFARSRTPGVADVTMLQL
jgi:Tol biopolymer transport system component